MTDYANRRIVDEGARGRLPSGPVDFMAIDNSDRRDRLRADRLQFYTLWNKRARDENCPLFNLLLMFRSLVVRRVGKHCSGKYAGHNESGSA